MIPPLKRLGLRIAAAVRRPNPMVNHVGLRAWGAFAGAAIALSTILGATPASAADCPPSAGACQSFWSSGTTGARVDIVFLGDGFTTSEQDAFFAAAKAVSDNFLSSSTYGDYKSLFNTWALFTPSAESGADHPSKGQLVDTAFDATFETAGIDYLLNISTSKALSELNTRFPEFDVAIMLVNDPAYGGSGGPVAAVSLHTEALEVARHEIGHTMAGLADEYPDPYPGYPEGDPEPNVASLAHLDPLKWSVWVTPDTPIPTPDDLAISDFDPIGAFEGARYKATGMFRPAPNCLMRALGVGFCPVCSEGMVLGFSRLSSTIDAPNPLSPAVIPAMGTSVFAVSLPDLPDLQISWAMDDAPVEGSAASIGVSPELLGLADGPHKLAITVTDATPLVRNDPDGVMTETFTWLLAVDSTLPPAGTGGAGGGGVGGGDIGGSGGGDGGSTRGSNCGCGVADLGDGPWTAAVLAAVGASFLRRRCRKVPVKVPIMVRRKPHGG